MNDPTPSVSISEPPLSVFIVAGESSGDNLAARLMAALRAQTGGNVQFAGVGGPAMEAEGLQSLFPMRELSLMGLAEVLPHLPRLIGRLRQTTAAARQLRPDIVITVDSPGFTMRLAKRLHGSGIPIVHYVAPQVWAWRQGRARKTARIIDHLMVLLPFEPFYFSQFGLPCSYVGHPVLESGADKGDGAAFRKRHGLAADDTVVCVLPGSRGSETKRLLPIFRDTLLQLEEMRGPITAIVPLAESVAEDVAVTCNNWPVRTLMVARTQDKHDAFAAANVALAKSGTVTLELAMAGVPMVVAYKVNAVTAYVVRRLIKVPFVSLVNLLADGPVVPELLQENCSPPRLAVRLQELLTNAKARKEQRQGFSISIENLGGLTPLPSVRAAQVVLAVARGENPAERISEPPETDDET